MANQESGSFDYPGGGSQNGQAHSKYKPLQNAINILNHVLLRKSAVAQLTKCVTNINLTHLNS